MKKHIAKLLAAVAMTWLSGSAIAGDPCAMPCETPAKGGWYGSAGVLYLKQVGTSDVAYRVDNFTGVDANGETQFLGSSTGEFSRDYNWSGRFEVGVKDASGFGLRVKYFWLDESSSLSVLDNSGQQSDPNFQGVVFNQVTGLVYRSANPLGVGFSSVGTETSPSLFTADRNLKLQAWDFDVTSDCKNCGGLDLTWFAGIRYLHIAQNYSATDTILDPATLEAPNVIPIQQVMISGHNLNAWGPTVGVEGRYPVLDSIKAFGSARFGILYAEGRQSVDVAEIPLGDTFYQPLIARNYGAGQERCYALPFGELEIGAEYSRVLGCDGPELFVRGSLIGLAYWGAGNSARVNSSNNPANEDLFFYGFATTVGIRY